jgi:hypothetical protein
VLDLLQNRRFAVLERLILVGRVCGKWSELEASPTAEERQLEFLENFAHAPRGHLDATRRPESIWTTHQHAIWTCTANS